MADFPKKQQQCLIPKYLLDYTTELNKNHPDPTDPWGGSGGDVNIEAGTGITITTESDDTKVISLDTNPDTFEVTADTGMTLEVENSNPLWKDSKLQMSNAGATRLEGTQISLEANNIYLNSDNAPYYVNNTTHEYKTLATTDQLFSGDYDDLYNKPTIPDAVSGTNDGTNWTSLTIGEDTYGLASGGSTYTAGNGIDITNNEISIDNTVALKTDIPTNYVTTDTTQTITGRKTFNPGSNSYLTVQSSYGIHLEHNNNNAYLSPTQFKITGGFGDMRDLEMNNYSIIHTTSNYNANNRLVFPDIYTQDADIYYTLPTESGTVALTSDIITSYNDLTDKPTIPTTTSQLTNNSGFITNTVNNLTNYTLTSNLATVATTGDYDDLTNKPTIPVVPTNVSAFTNDSNYIPSDSRNTKVYSTAYLLNDEIYRKATYSWDHIGYISQGTYNTLAFPEDSGTIALTKNIPTATSELTNDSGYITSADIPTNTYYYKSLNSNGGTLSTADLNAIKSSPKKYILTINQVQNGTIHYFFYENDTSTIISYITPLYSDTAGSYSYVEYKRYIISINKTTGVYTISDSYDADKVNRRIDLGTGLTGSYSESLGKETISVDATVVALKTDIPTKTSDLTNDSGYITGITSSDVTTALGYTPGTSNFSGDYTDLTNKPTIPTVNDNTITITQGGVTKGSFTLNQNTNQTIALDNVPGMIGEVLYDVPNGEAGVNPITMAHSFADYSYVDIQYRCFDNAYEVRSQRIYDPNGKHVYLDWDVLVSGAVYAKKSIYILNGNTMTVRDGTDMQAWYSNGSTMGTQVTPTTDYQHQIKITKVVGYKANNSPLISGKKYTHHLSLFNNSNVQSATLRVTATIETNSSTPFTVDALKSWLYNNNYRTVANGIYEASGTYYESSTSFAVLGIRCYNLNDGAVAVVPKGANVYSIPQISYIVDVVEEDNIVVQIPNALYYIDDEKYVNSNYISSTGYITSGQKELTFTIIVPKLLTNITSVTVNKLECLLRGVGGYVNGSSNIDYVGQSGYTINTYIAAPNAVTISVIKSSAYSSSTNNTPVNVAFVANGLQLTFNQ